MATPTTRISRLKLPYKFVTALDDYVLSNHVETNRTSFFKILIGDYKNTYNISLSSSQETKVARLKELLETNLSIYPESISMRLHTELSDAEVRDRFENIATNIVILGLYDFFNSRMTK